MTKDRRTVDIISRQQQSKTLQSCGNPEFHMMGSTLKAVQALLVLGAVVPSAHGAPASAKQDRPRSANVNEAIFKRQNLGGIAETCRLCPAVQRLSNFIPSDVQNQADNVNQALRDLITNVGPSQPGGLGGLGPG